MKKKTDVKRNEMSEPEIMMDTSLNPGFSLGVDVDIMNPSGKDYITGESVNEHRIMEQANEFIAEEEVKEQFNNL